MNKRYFTALFAPLALTACAPSPNAPITTKSIVESAEAQGGVCPGQVFNFISDANDGSIIASSTGYARVEKVSTDGSATLTVISRQAKSEFADKVVIKNMPIRAEGCGPYTPKI